MLTFNRKRSEGFTIVELLIVIVVIAILAAITIVSYNGIQKRAAESAVKSDLRNAATALEVAAIDGPSTVTSFPSSVKASGKVGLSLSTPTGGSRYCINGSYQGTSVIFYYDANSGIQTGSCSGAVISGSLIGTGSAPTLVTIEDNFNRANSTTTMGSTPSGQPWITYNGTWGINSNRAYTVTNNENDTVVMEPGFTNAEVSARFYGTGDNKFPGILARANPTNAYIIELSGSSGALELARMSGFEVSAAAPNGTYTEGALLTLRIRDVSGGVELTVLVNNVQVLQVTDTASGRPNGTYFGFRYGTYNSGANLGMRYEDFSIKQLQ